jgi:hypothetical protein
MAGGLAATFKGLVDSTTAIATLVGSSKGKAELTDLRDRLIAAQNGILEIQEQLAALITENDELKQQAVKRKAWETEKSNYQLEQIARGVYAYSRSAQTSEPAHYLCCRCYDDGKKSILQFNHQSSSPSANCSVCHAVLHLTYRPPGQTKLSR